MTRARKFRLGVLAIALAGLAGFALLREFDKSVEPQRDIDAAVTVQEPELATAAVPSRPNESTSSSSNRVAQPLIPLASEPAATKLLQLRLVTGPRSDRKPAADIDVEFGFGDGLQRVGAAVGRGRSDAKGGASFDCDERTWRSASVRGDWLWARVADSDEELAEHWFELDRKAASPAFTIVVGPTSIVRGIVFDGSGAPTSALVRAVTEGEPWFDAVISTVRSGPDGKFTIATRGERIVDILARSDEHGVGSLLRVDVERQRFAAPLELRLAGSGTLRGIVRDSRGQPVPGLPMRAGTAKLCADEIYYNRAESSTRFDLVKETREIDFEGLGRACVWFHTDSRGEFEVHGLREDPYVLHGYPQHLPLVLLPREILTPDPVPSDGALLDLVTASAVLRIRVENPDGSPWQPALETSRETDPAARVVAIRELEGWSVAHMEAKALPCTDLGGGVFTFVAETFGQSVNYRVGLRGRGLPWSPLDVHVPEGAGVIDVRLGARPLADGVLALTLRHGASIDPSTHVEMRVLDLVSRAQLMPPRTLRPIDGPFRIPLPAGVYRIELDASPVWGQHQRGPASMVADTVWIRSDEERELDLELPPGARIVVNVKDDEARPGDPQHWGGPGLVLERDGEVRRHVLYTKRDPRGEDLLVWVPWDPRIGAQVSGPLPAGPGTIVLVLHDGRKGRARVDLRDGETTTVDIEVD